MGLKCSRNRVLAYKATNGVEMDVITGIQSALEITGKLRELSKKLQDAEFNILLANLTSELADTKLEAANLKFAVTRLTEENQKLTDRLNNKESPNPKFVNGGYKFPDDDGLYCTGCFDSKQQKIRLGDAPAQFISFGQRRCPICKTFAKM